MKTRFEYYTEALRLLNTARARLDDANGLLRDIRFRTVDIEAYVNLMELSATLASLTEDVDTADCPECGHPLSGHGNTEGCTRERGDRPMGDDNILVDAGPCGCTWGQK